MKPEFNLENVKHIQHKLQYNSLPFDGDRDAPRSLDGYAWKATCKKLDVTDIEGESLETITAQFYGISLELAESISRESCGPHGTDRDQKAMLGLLEKWISDGEPCSWKQYDESIAATGRYFVTISKPDNSIGEIIASKNDDLVTFMQDMNENLKNEFDSSQPHPLVANELNPIEEYEPVGWVDEHSMHRQDVYLAALSVVENEKGIYKDVFSWEFRNAVENGPDSTFIGALA